ncbi:chitooligosaccharide deacetylase [Cordyceps fumosorosea ARSEF 2679]|uniref:chitin deacetylase n=1 Tax=Cordyceps fumosorosea (strain ARSEF 2679) TaxID=1081104 RepID=A0A168DYP7_CORFA|nr:chitooligosaccharide deacetylase [Cordyceps fumosorosea ARSEF 2679]OAA73161.1 chitooligosaccharide deacetylase [Cordyceps fumosorosea ARSEF 2679]
MPRIPFFRFPTKLRRRVRRNRMATLALLALLAALLLLVPLWSLWCVYKPPRFLLGLLRARYPDVLFEATTAERLVALSLDDAPSAHTDEILAALREHDARATFFVIGEQVAEAGREEVLRKVVRGGHELANHGMRDEPATRLALDTLEREAGEVRAKLVAAYEAEGKVLENNYYRPGSGFFNTKMRDLLGNRGYRITLGSVYPHDPQIRSPERNAAHILSMAHPGAIIICHDRREWTAPMLRMVLPALKERGYRVVTITELVKAAEPLGGRR